LKEGWYRAERIEGDVKRKVEEVSGYSDLVTKF